MYDRKYFMIGTKWYTQAIKLPAGGYSMSQFFLYKDNAPAGFGPEDVIVYATLIRSLSYLPDTSTARTHRYRLHQD